MAKNSQTIWWLISILMFVLAIYLFLIFNPVFKPSFSAFIFGFLLGGLSYLISRLIRSIDHKQIVNLPVIFINSVVLAPIIEEMLFRFGLISVLFNNSMNGVIVSLILWVILHVIYGKLVAPTKYYVTLRGVFDSLTSGIILAAAYVFSDFNLFVPWIAHTLHNFLIWFSVAFPKATLSIQQSRVLVGVHRTLNVFSQASSKIILITIYLNFRR